MRSIAFVLRLFVVLAAVGTVAVAQEQTPWRTQLRTLPAQQAPKEPLATEALLRPELAFKPARRWVFFAELAKEFASEDVKPAVVQQVLEEGGKALRQALAAEKADKDLGTATALLTVQLWQWSTGKELSETQADAVHAQTVLALATPDVAAMRDADKQRCWELCVGYTTWFAALFEAAPDAAQQAPLRQAAAQVFRKLVGVAPDELTLDARGLVAAAGRGKPPSAGAPRPPAAAAGAGAEFDVFRCVQPPGCDEQKASGYLFLRRNDGRDYCQMFLYPVAAGAGDAKADFDKAWNFFARKPAEGVGEPASLRTATVDGWTMHAATAAGQYGGQPYHIVLRSFTQGRAQYFAACVFTKAAQAAVTDAFLDSVQVDPAKLQERLRSLGIAPGEVAAGKVAAGAAAGAPTAMKIAYPKMTYKDGTVVQAFFDCLQVARSDGTEVRIHFPNRELDNTGDRPDRREHESRYWDACVAPQFAYGAIAVRVRDSFGWGATIYEAEATDRRDGRRVCLNLLESWENGSCTVFVALAPDRATLHAKYPTADDVTAMTRFNEFHATAADLAGSWSSYAGAAASYYYTATGLYAGTVTAQTSDDFTFRPDGTYESSHSATTTYNTTPTQFRSRYEGRFQALPGTLNLTNRLANDPGEFHCRLEAVRGGYALRLVNKKFTGNNTLLVKTR